MLSSLPARQRYQAHTQTHYWALHARLLLPVQAAVVLEQLSRLKQLAA